MDPRFALLLACFFLSGFAALLYQTAWTRELSFVFGTSELAVAAVLAAYMGGLALGSAAAGRYAMRLRRMVLVYGLLELAIALSALAIPGGIRLINGLYVSLLGGGGELPEGGSTAVALFQLAAAFAVLLPPTAFMGATLPLLARHAVRSESEIGSRVGVLYAVNTAGAIGGTLCAAFWLMPSLGLRHTVWVGAALNGLVFVLAALLARGTAGAPAPEAPRVESRSSGGGAVWILPAIALSGAVSFAYEVLWSRLLGYLLGASLDAFAAMLATFLLGIALGSMVAARVATRRERAAVGFAVAQLGIALTSYVAFAVADWLPSLSVHLGAGPGHPFANAVLAATTLLPITLCIGATFPFAVRLLARSPAEAAAATARTYAWNTVGAIVGALGAGFVLLPVLGFEGTVNVGVAASLMLAAVTALSVRPRRSRLAVVAVVAGVALLVAPLGPPWTLLRSSPLSSRQQDGETLYAAVGRSSTVLLVDRGYEFRLLTNGLPEAVIERRGSLPLSKVARLLGQLPGLLHPEAREMLVVGLGGGSALEAVPSTFSRVDVIELEEKVLAANERVSSERAIDPLADPRVRVHVGDARGALQLTEKRYDAIVSQPSHPWTAGASHLYTREFFILVRSHLKPEGLFVQWIGLQYVDEALLRSLAATLVDVFGNVEVYQPGGSMGIIFAASVESFDSLEGARGALRAVPKDHARFGIHRVEDVAAMRVLDPLGTRVLAEGAVLNTDDHNLLAARGSRLGRTALAGRTVRRLWSDEPTLAESDGFDRSALIRTLVATGFADRADALARSEDRALEETGLGWIELGLGRPARAARHFVRALALEPDAPDAPAGLVLSRQADLTRGKSVEALVEEDLDARLVAVIAGWRHAAAADWEAVAALEDELARIGPGEAAFEEASRLRVRWRLETKEKEAGAQAQEIAETLLLRAWNPYDALQHARAAVAAGDFATAWGSLHRIAQTLNDFPATQTIASAALEIADALPEEMAREVRARLESASRPRGPRR